MIRLCACGARGKKMICRCDGVMCEPCQLKHRCPIIARMTKASLDKNEGGLKRDVGELLDELHILWERVNAGGFRGRMQGAAKGTPDFFVFPGGGRFGAIETKATHPDGCSNKTCGCATQREWRADWERRGGFYILARKLDDVYAGLGLPLPTRQEALL